MARRRSGRASSTCHAIIEVIPAGASSESADSSDSDKRAHIIGLIEHCPSDSHTYALEDDGPQIEPDLPVSIAVTTAEEPLAGPLWVTGGIPIVRADGKPFQTR